MSKKIDIIVIGGGPGGYVAAIRAAQLGFKTAVIEKENLGGICLNWGCIPTKALLKSAEVYDIVKNRAGSFGVKTEGVDFDFAKIIKRSRNVSKKVSKGVEFLMRKNEIEHIKGFGKISAGNKIDVLDPGGKMIEQIESDKILIATGAHPRTFEQIPVDRKKIITSSEAMTLEKQPESLVIIGAGAIGVEFAYFYNTLGTKVTIIEMLDRILPVEDREISDVLAKSLKKSGIKILTSTSVSKAEVVEGNVIVTFEKEGKKDTISAELALNAVGVTGNITGFGLEELGVETDRRFIKVDKNYKTNIPDIYAIGDVNGPPWLAHVASVEGITCVERIKGMDIPNVNYNAIPGCTYCNPQVASIGLTEEKALEQGKQIRVGRFPYTASGKAGAVGEREGMVKLIFDDEYGELLGAHIVGAEATDMIAELGIAISHEADYESILRTVHAHPTLSEMVMEAAGNAYGESIHI